ncbi:MAG TPA: hypothetical protein VNQ79_05435 [Blastocatellia bacterium]|nr:hypothetical protein [Blastocatellia bacterium]
MNRVEKFARMTQRAAHLRACCPPDSLPSVGWRRKIRPDRRPAHQRVARLRAGVHTAKLEFYRQRVNLPN